MNGKGKSCKPKAGAISRLFPSERDMADGNFNDGQTVQAYLRRKIEHNPKIDPANRKLYLEWTHDLLAESLSISRVLKYTYILMTFERFLARVLEA